MLSHRCSWTTLPGLAGIAVSAVYSNVLVDDPLFRQNRLSRRSIGVIAGFRGGRLVEAVLRVKMFVVENRVGRLRALMLVGRHLFDILARRSMPRVVMVVAV